jgi:hypothetical protein
MNFLAVVLLSQLAAARQSPVLTFPEPGVDDTASYQGYQTRFYRDAAGNTVQIYIEGRAGRVVHLLANADNESIAFTARDPRGRPLTLVWANPVVQTTMTGRMRTMTHHLVAEAPAVDIGWFLLGSMRVERDFQYWGKHREPFHSPAFTVAELDRLLEALARLSPTARLRHLTHLRAPDVETLRRRLHPRVTTRATPMSWTARATQLSLDGRDSLSLVIRVDPRFVAAARAGDSISLRARRSGRVPFTVEISSSARALTPIARDRIFTPEFLALLAAERDSVRWLERQVRGVELLVSREKLMAGLPAYATYFGRDMLVSALMMRSIWRDEMSEFVIASVLRKLSPSGEVSHEEALGGQAVREAAAEYATLVDDHFRHASSGDQVAAAAALSRARMVLRDHRRVRENYHMIDDEFQFPILAARWLSDANVPAARKRAFLLDSSDGSGTRLARLLREFALVARMTAAYAHNPIATNLVSFAPRDSGRWSSASWRDSGAGYAGGRFAMDVNAIWVPHALEGIASILETLPTLGFSPDSIARATPALSAETPFGQYLRDPRALRGAAATWWGAESHFLVRLGPGDVRRHVDARLAALPEPERRHWLSVLSRTTADRDSLIFLALALDAQGRPIGVANSDPATRLFLGDRERTAPSVSASNAQRDAGLFVRPYPVGLFIDGVGPVVANDAYADAPVWSAFERDRYHGPRVVWGREVNLFLLGVASHIARTTDTAHAATLRAALAEVRSAAEASGFQSELWSYEVRDGRAMPVRYGTGSDVQLWSTTDLAVYFALRQLR